MIAALKRLENLHQDWLTGVATYASLLGKSTSVLSFAFEVRLRSENSERVVKAVKLHELTNDLCAEAGLRVFAHFLG